MPSFSVVLLRTCRAPSLRPQGGGWPPPQERGGMGGHGIREEDQVRRVEILWSGATGWWSILSGRRCLHGLPDGVHVQVRKSYVIIIDKRVCSYLKRMHLTGQNLKELRPFVTTSVSMCSKSFKRSCKWWGPLQDSWRGESSALPIIIPIKTEMGGWSHWRRRGRQKCKVSHCFTFPLLINRHLIIHSTCLEMSLQKFISHPGGQNMYHLVHPASF